MNPDPYIRKIVAGAPPLTDEQRANLRQLLRPATAETPQPARTEAAA